MLTVTMKPLAPGSAASWPCLAGPLWEVEGPAGDGTAESFYELQQGEGPSELLNARSLSWTERLRAGEWNRAVSCLAAHRPLSFYLVSFHLS